MSEENCYVLYMPISIGDLTLASDGNALTGLWIKDQKHFAEHHADPIFAPELPIFRDVTYWLDQYFEGNFLPADQLPLKPIGTMFQQQVWNILRHLPQKQTLTYGQIAKQLGTSGAAQAVGAAVGRNPISIIIPCHRVLGAGGKLTGYAGGIQAKTWLLKHEGILQNEELQHYSTGIPL